MGVMGVAVKVRWGCREGCKDLRGIVEVGKRCRGKVGVVESDAEAKWVCVRVGGVVEV